VLAHAFSLCVGVFLSHRNIGFIFLAVSSFGYEKWTQMQSMRLPPLLFTSQYEAGSGQKACVAHPRTTGVTALRTWPLTQGGAFLPFLLDLLHGTTIGRAQRISPPPSAVTFEAGHGHKVCAAHLWALGGIQPRRLTALLCLFRILIYY
jgi:hypothetical protein